jgi:hypothetical protein
MKVRITLLDSSGRILGTLGQATLTALGHRGASTAAEQRRLAATMQSTAIVTHDQAGR